MLDYEKIEQLEDKVKSLTQALESLAESNILYKKKLNIALYGLKKVKSSFTCYSDIDHEYWFSFG